MHLMHMWSRFLEALIELGQLQDVLTCCLHLQCETVTMRIRLHELCAR